MCFLVYLERGFVVEFLRAEVTLELLLLLDLLITAIAVQLGNVGVPLQVKSEVSPAI